MVRNSSSMQSLRSSFSPSTADFSAASQQPDTTSKRYNTTPNPAANHENSTSTEPFARIGQPAVVQLSGQDAYTKDIMNKMAMGKATKAEQTAFLDRVREARLSPAIKNLLHPAEEETKPSHSPLAVDDNAVSARATHPIPSSCCPADRVALERAAERYPDLVEQVVPKLQALAVNGPSSIGNELLRIRNRDNKIEYVPALQTAENKRCASVKPPSIQGSQKTSSNPSLFSSPQRPSIQKATRANAAKYTKPFCQFLTENPTVFHAVSAMKKDLKDAGWTELSERDSWDIKPSGRYFAERNGSSLIAFSVGANYKAGDGAAILAGHVDALTARLKPVSTVPNKAGYLQLGVAPYAGGLNSTWWDRDLGIGGRVHIKEGDKVVTKLVKLDWPIARIPTLAPHFGAAAQGPFNPETQMVPIMGLDTTSAGPFQPAEPFSQPPLLRGANGSIGSFVHSQPPALVKVIAEALDLSPSSIRNIVNWELELFDVQPATVGGLNKEFIYAGRIDDKLCSWAALQALIESQPNDDDSSIIKVVGLFDDEEIGSLLRQGARGNFLPTVIERAVGSLADHRPNSDLMGRTYANSFLVSSDVTHAVNPNFLNAYLENHAPHLNVGVAISADSNGHMTTDSVSTAILQRCAEKADAKLQVFQIRNDSRSGGTVGPMLSSALGVRAIDAGLAQLSMHSIRATTGALDPGLGVILFSAFLNGFEEVDKEFRD